MVYGVKVPESVGRDVKGLLKKKRLYEDKYLPLKTAGFIVFPLRTNNLKCKNELKRITDKFLIDTFDFRENRRTRSFRRELEKILPKDFYQRAARAYEQVGDVGIITVFPEMERYEDDIASALMDTNKGIRLVLKKVSTYSGNKRVREYETLKGSGSPETIHSENGVRVKVDVTQVYFSARTANERKRISSFVKSAEQVLVLFSGCAPYPLVISKNSHAESIVGVELDKVAHDYAEQNVSLNSLNNITLICEGARGALKKLNRGFDRIVIPHPTAADFYLGNALSVLKKGGVVHMYLFSKPEKLDYAKDKILATAQERGFAIRKIDVIEQQHVSSEVKKYCFDIQCR